MDNLLTVVIPAYNEELAIPSLLPDLLKYCHARNWKLVIVNDGSTDKTQAILTKYENDPILKIIHHKLNRGYGAALKSGILAAHTPYLVTIDADGQHPLQDIDIMFKQLLEHQADLIIATRTNQPSASFYRGVGKAIIRSIARVLVPNNLSDLNSGMKLYRTELAKQYIVLCPNSMAFSDIITLIFCNERNIIIEHEIKVNKRLAGHSTINTRTAIETVLEIFNLIMLFNPIRLLAPISLTLVLIGVAWSLPFLLQSRGLSVASLLLLLSGIIIFSFALIAQQLSLIRQERMAFFSNNNETSK